MTRLSRRPSGSSQVISRSKGKHLLEFPSLIKAHDIHDKAQDMATIILQEEAATRAMIEKDQEQPQSSRASNALHVRQSTVRPTGKENKTKRAIKKKKKGVKVRSQKLQRTNYSQGEAHVRLTEAVKCAEELKTLRVNGEAAPQEWGGVWPSQKCIAMKYKVARSVLTKTLLGKRDLDTHQGRQCVLGKDVEHKIVQYATDMDDHGFGLNMKNMMWLTQRVAAAYGMQGFKATYRWLAGLSRRYPELAKRRSQAFQRLRAGGMNATQISEYFTILQKVIDECLTADDLMEMDPNLIANLNETNITQDIHGGLIISKRGKRDVKKGQEVDKKQILRHPDGREDLKCLKEGTGWAMTPCGYMNDETWDEKVTPWIINQWVVENKDKLTISESFTCTEDDLAVLAVAEEYDIQSETVAQDIITVRGMLSSPRLQESINTIIDSAEIEQTVTADDVMDLLHRVERYEVSLDLPEDAILAKPWWQEKIEEWLQRAGCGDDAVDGACDDGHSQGLSRKKARGPKIHKATGERLSAPRDCTAPQNWPCWQSN
ncbi:hypothetical protein EMCRGX_G022135 [Ephydatia muelleri]